MTRTTDRGSAADVPRWQSHRGRGGSGRPRVLRSKRLFRYYGTVEGPSAVEAFEATFAASDWGRPTPSRSRRAPPL